MVDVQCKQKLCMNIWWVSSQNGLTPFWSNLRYLWFKLLKYKENKKICNTFDHNFKNIPLYTCIMRKVSLERYYFVLYDCALTSKISKMALKSFCDKTLHIVPCNKPTNAWSWSCVRTTFMAVVPCNEPDVIGRCTMYRSWMCFFFMFVLIFKIHTNKITINSKLQ